MHLTATRIFPVVAAVLLMTLAGCAGTTKPSRFYVLTTIPEGEAAPGGAEQPGPALGIGPVNLPKYLDRPQIVTRMSPNRLEIAEFDRWAEPLGANFSRVLAENLSALLNTDQVAFHPWQRSTPVDYQVALQVLRFDRAPDGDIVLHVLWRLLRNDGRQLLLTRKSALREAVDAPGDYAAIVATQSRVIEQVSRQIAEAIVEVDAQRSR